MPDEPMTDAEIERGLALCKAYRERSVLSTERALTFADVADQHWPRALAEVEQLRERIKALENELRQARNSPKQIWEESEK